MKRFLHRNGKLLLYAIILVLCFFIGRYAYSYTFPPDKELRTVYRELDLNTALQYYRVSEDHKTLTIITLCLDVLTPKVGPFDYTGFLLIEIRKTNNDYIAYEIYDYGPDGTVDMKSPMLTEDIAQKLYNNEIHEFYLFFTPSI